MSSINLSKTQYASFFSGFRNSNNLDLTIDIASFNLTVGNAVIINTTTPMENINDISATRVKFAPLESFYHLIDGYVFTQYPDFTSPSFEIGATTYFASNNHVLSLYVANQTGGTVTIPTLHIGMLLDLYDTPFQS